MTQAPSCGVSSDSWLRDPSARPSACNPVSASGGVLPFNAPRDGPTAEEISKLFTEVIIAPDADDNARRILGAKKNLRLLIAGGLPDPRGPGWSFRSVAGGFLVQTRDNVVASRAELKVVTKRQPTTRELDDLLFAFTVAKHVKSNTIVYAKDDA